MDALTTAPLSPYTLRADNGAPGSGTSGLADVAQEFEAQFIYQLLKQMRESMSMSLAGGDEDGTGAGSGFEALGQTLDVEFARQLSRNGGIGLARLMTEAAARGSMTPALASDVIAATEARSHGDMQVPESLRDSVSPWPVSSGTVEPASLEDLFDGPITSNYGWRNDPFSGARKFHGGIDIAMAYGVEVPAAEDGRVIAAGEQGRYGNTVVIEHPSGTRTRYAHLSEIGVQPGQTVGAGQTIGRAGSSGAATGPHLHFEVIVDSQRKDPLSMEARAFLGEQR